MSAAPASAPAAASGDPRVAVVIGSTRPARICPDIAGWTQRAFSARSPLRYELVDLADVNLPMLDEPLMGALHDYRHAHTKAWSARIESFSAFVFVLPQYNWGYPAPLKNALDYLYDEWREKPVTSVTYGTRGGGKAADQIREVFTGLHMRPLPSRIEVVTTKDHLDTSWQLVDVEATMSPYRDEVRRIDAEMVAALRAADVSREGGARG